MTPTTPRPQGRRSSRFAATRAGWATAAFSLSLLAAWPSPGQASPSGTDNTLGSRLDAPLFYQLLIGEIELRKGEAATAYAVILDAARRTREEPLFERAVEIALRAQAGTEALNAAVAWRTAHPQSLPAVQAQTRILLALNRLPAMVEPLKRWIELTPEADRPGTIGTLPRLFRSHPDPRAALQVLQAVLIPLAESPSTRTPAQLALARGLMQAGQMQPALALAQDVALRDAMAPGPVLIALELLPQLPQAETLVRAYLSQTGAEPLIRMSFSQWLVSRQQYGPALVELRQVVKALPDQAQAWFQLGAVALEAREAQEAESALKRFLELQSPSNATPNTAASEGTVARPATDDPAADARMAARLMLSQLASERGDQAAAQRWLQGLEAQTSRLDVQMRRAIILARQGRLEQARGLIRALPETESTTRLTKLMAESQVLRTVERWKDARTVLSQALEQFPNEVDVHYELALVLEKLGRHADMERHLRRIIELKPSHPHAHNALGYSLAERGIRLDEAHQLITRALELAPGDPFITDSLAWVEYRQGRFDRAVELLRQAYASRPDTEIGAHLGEVLWVSGDKQAARQIWREVRQRDAANKVLRETLSRLKVDL